MNKKQPGIYIIQSIKNNRYYIGSTENITLRLLAHNQGKVVATKYMKPWKLKFFMPYPTIKSAKQIEYKLKRLKRKDIIDGIIKKQKSESIILLMLG